MDRNSKKDFVSITCTLAEWLHFVDLIDLACDDLNNKKLSNKLRNLSSDIIGSVTPLGSFAEVRDEK